MKLFFILFIICFSFPAKPYGPRELTALAQERAPLIKMYLEQESVTEGHLKQSKLFANPVLTYQGGRLKSGTQNGQVTDITVMQPVPWPGKRSASIKSQEFLNKLAHLDLVETKLLLSHRVYLSSYELASLVDLEKHHLERRERFSLIAKYLSSRPLASPKQSLEKEIIESQIRILEKFMYEVTARKNGLLEELALLTGINHPEVQVDWKKLPFSHSKDFYLSHLGDGLRLKKLKQTLQLSENKIEEARYQARPDIMVGVNYRQENVAPVNHFYHGQVALVVPIIDHGQHSVQTARAQVRKDEASIKLATMENQTDFAYAYEALEASQKNLIVFPFALKERSEIRFKKAEDAFRKGLIDVLTFLQSDSQVHENIGQVYTTRLEYLTRLSRLEQIIGHEMESP